ncbi:MAG: TlpA family protein disulfide reductase [Alteromonadaceae bacterium]|nr:TlpA family protein disulfide reductase [Alteromonadaceae bacterium]
MTQMETNKTSKFRSLRRSLIEICVFIVILMAIVWYQQRNMLVADGTVTIPEHQFVSLDGRTQPLLDNDKPTLVYFFAPWCKVCYWSINNVDELDSEQVNVVKIALSFQNLEEVERFVQETGTKRRNVLLGTRSTAHTFQISAFPSVYILNNQGAVVGRSVGYSTEFGMKVKLAFAG